MVFSPPSLAVSRHSGLYAPFAVAAVWHCAPFGICALRHLRRLACALFGICAVSRFALFPSSRRLDLGYDYWLSIRIKYFHVPELREYLSYFRRIAHRDDLKS